MTAKKKRIPPVYWALNIPMGRVVKGQSFDLVKDLNTTMSKVLNDAREDWLFILLNNNGIKVDRSMSKRELQEVLSAHKTVIKKLVNSNLDRVFIDDIEVGTWDCNYEYRFSNAGDFFVTVRHTATSKNLPV
jgi:hypothetical protein